ncbi:MAG: SDR family NAD(P)-dependent oxidoreductase [Pseudomonadota bacterium]
MTKTILITGATDGIGLLTAKKLAAAGHEVLIHGRSAAKLAAAAEEIGSDARTYAADLADLAAVDALAEAVLADHPRLDVLINNAGVLKTPQTLTPSGQDVRFVVNTFAPYRLAQRLLPAMPSGGRIVNLSSAAQAPVDVAAMERAPRMDDMTAYAQSKLAITIWTREMAKALPDGPVAVAVNPGSLLASKMVKQGFGVAGNDLNIGADILIDAALGERFADASGAYFDNDSGRFADPHAAALDPVHSQAVMEAVERLSMA